MWESSQWLGKILYWLKEHHESKDVCPDHSDITEILLKTAFHHSFNQSINQPFADLFLPFVYFTF